MPPIVLLSDVFWTIGLVNQPEQVSDPADWVMATNGLVATLDGFERTMIVI